MSERLFSLRFKLPSGKVSITAYDRNEPMGPHGHTTLRCQLTFQGKVLFPHCAGFTVGIPAGQCIDGDYAKEAVTELFCLKPKDTDPDFFADYTPEQLEWVTANGEDLSVAKRERFGWDT